LRKLALLPLLRTIWSTDTYGHPGSWLVVQGDGNVVIYDPSGAPLWATNTMLGKAKPRLAFIQDTHPHRHGWEHEEKSPPPWFFLNRGTNFWEPFLKTLMNIENLTCPEYSGASPDNKVQHFISLIFSDLQLHFSN
jgi:hypothetical protein